MGLTMTRGKHMNSSAILTLGAEMNRFAHFVAMPLRGHGNVTGADAVTTWTTSYPFGVDFSRGSRWDTAVICDGGDVMQYLLAPTPDDAGHRHRAVRDEPRNRRRITSPRKSARRTVYRWAFRCSRR
jgi:hypothetical protein